MIVFTLCSLKVKVLVAQSSPTLCDPMDCSSPGSSVLGIFQARILEWLSFPTPGDLPDPGMEPTSLASPALQEVLYLLSHQGGLFHCTDGPCVTIH